MLTKVVHHRATEFAVCFIPNVTFPMTKRILFLVALLLSTSATFSAGVARASRPITWAEVIKLVNVVKFKPASDKWRDATKQDRLKIEGEQLFTSRRSRADLRLSEGSLLRLSSNTHLWLRPNSRQLVQRSGTALYVIRPGGGRTTISTPYGRAGIRGSALFVRVNEEAGTMIVGALTNNPEGPMEIEAKDGQAQKIEAGQMAVVRDGKISLFEFDLKTFYQTSSLVQGYGLDGQAPALDEKMLADPEVQQTLEAVRGETLPALTAQKAVQGEDVAVNPEILRPSLRQIQTDELIMQSSIGRFDRNAPQNPAQLAAVRQPVVLQSTVNAPLPNPIPVSDRSNISIPQGPQNPLPPDNQLPTPSGTDVGNPGDDRQPSIAPSPNPPRATPAIPNPGNGPAIPAQPNNDVVPDLPQPVTATPVPVPVESISSPNIPEPIIPPIAQPAPAPSLGTPVTPPGTVQPPAVPVVSSPAPTPTPEVIQPIIAAPTAPSIAAPNPTPMPESPNNMPPVEPTTPSMPVPAPVSPDSGLTAPPDTQNVPPQVGTPDVIQQDVTQPSS